jgi:hypothetical protein
MSRCMDRFTNRRLTISVRGGFGVHVHACTWIRKSIDYTNVDHFLRVDSGVKAGESLTVSSCKFS